MPTGLIVACQASDREAQHQLYVLRRERVFGLMSRMVGAQDAPDVTQQVFLQVFRKITSFRELSTFDTWLWRVAVNEAQQHLRRHRKLPAAMELLDPVHRGRGHTLMVEERDLLEQALERLDPELRCLFLLREHEGLSYRELAAAMDLPEGTIASRLNRARRELKKHLVDLGWEL